MTYQYGNNAFQNNRNPQWEKVEVSAYASAMRQMARDIFEGKKGGNGLLSTARMNNDTAEYSENLIIGNKRSEKYGPNEQMVVRRLNETPAIVDKTPNKLNYDTNTQMVVHRIGENPKVVGKNIVGKNNNKNNNQRQTPLPGTEAPNPNIKNNVKSGQGLAYSSLSDYDKFVLSGAHDFSKMSDSERNRIMDRQDYLRTRVDMTR